MCSAPSRLRPIPHGSKTEQASSDCASGKHGTYGLRGNALNSKCAIGCTNTDLLPFIAGAFLIAWNPDWLTKPKR